LKFYKKDKLNKSENTDIKEENFNSSNIIKNIKYSSEDLKGNKYIILAEEGEIDLNNNDIIFLKKVTALITMVKDKDTIKIISDYGKYNTINYDTIFSKNVEIKYLDNNINSNYLDFSMIKNKLIISKNVVYTNPENILKADVIELDTITKNTKIFMHNSKKKVNIESRE
tara:strand:- start:221 stop:730 length:510 start_codon:yes stop_codon:yes gene_type:complete